MKTEKMISCPKCEHNFDVNEILYNQIAMQIKTDFNKKAGEDKKEFELKIRKQLLEEKNEELLTYKEELQRKTEQVKELNSVRAALERTKREKEELKTQIEIESELKLTEAVNNENERLKKVYAEKTDLKIAEKEHLIDSLKTQIQVLTRKVEQGSMQVQGEVQELAIENYLRENFPLDVIEEIKKGQRGADCLQIVNSRSRINCGSIYYESKRTKDFSSA